LDAIIPIHAHMYTSRWYSISCRQGVLPFILYAAVDCGGLPNPANGQVTTSTTTFDSNATYSCNNGYTLSGSTTRNCLADATWSGTEPTCSRKYVIYSIVAESCTILSEPWSQGTTELSSLMVGRV